MNTDGKYHLLGILLSAILSAGVGLTLLYYVTNYTLPEFGKMLDGTDNRKLGTDTTTVERKKE